jgi:hypothetical protein
MEHIMASEDNRPDIDTGNSAVPPYEGRTESTEDATRSSADNPANVGGGAGPVEHDEMKSPEPESTPGGATASPADEQPASEASATEPSDPGTGPAHYPGTPRGEDAAEREGKEAGREDTGAESNDEAGRPTGESSNRDQTSIDPQEGNTDRTQG